MIPDYNHKTKIINSKEYIFDEIRKKWIFTTPEEIVRQNCWKFLHFEKNYPRGLITIEKELKILKAIIGIQKSTSDTNSFIQKNAKMLSNWIDLTLTHFLQPF